GVRLRRAWQAERLPKLLLPHPQTGHPLRIGRDPANGLRLTHETVSRVHAELHYQGGLWVLRDLGSANGTTVNGRRVVGAAGVRADLRYQGGRWVLRDLGSANGTTVNGRRVVGAAVVREGDQVGFGDMTYRLSAD